MRKRLCKIASADTGILHIPDWRNLSGVQGWLVYALPRVQDGTIALEEAFNALTDEFPDAYMIWVSNQSPERRTESITEFLQGFY